MKKILLLIATLMLGFTTLVSAAEQETSATDTQTIAAASSDYTLGPHDVLGIEILEPEKISTRAVVSPDGSITAPYIGQVQVSGQTATQIRETIVKRLSDGYLKYPSVMVSLLAPSIVPVNTA